MYICETLNMMYLKSSLEKTIMNFLWILIKKVKSLLYLDKNERIDKMVQLSEDTLLYSRWVCPFSITYLYLTTKYLCQSSK